MLDMAMMAENPEGKHSAFVIGNDYHLPVLFDQLDEDYVLDVRRDPSITPLQFANYSLAFLLVMTGIIIGQYR